MAKKAKTEPNFITGSELARRLGVSEPAVRKAVNSGRILPALIDPKGRRWFDEETARRQWSENTATEKLPPSAAAKAALVPADASAKTVTPSEVRVMEGLAKTRILTFKAQTLEQELVGLEDVARLWEEHIADAKRQLLALPADLRMRIPVLTREHSLLIDQRIRLILENLAGWKPQEKV